MQVAGEAMFPPEICVQRRKAWDLPCEAEAREGQARRGDREGNGPAEAVLCEAKRPPSVPLSVEYQFGT